MVSETAKENLPEKEFHTRWLYFVLSASRDTSDAISREIVKLNTDQPIAGDQLAARILEKGRCIAAGSIDVLTDDIVHAHLSV